MPPGFISIIIHVMSRLNSRILTTKGRTQVGNPNGLTLDPVCPIPSRLFRSSQTRLGKPLLISNIPPASKSRRHAFINKPIIRPLSRPLPNFPVPSTLDEKCQGTNDQDNNSCDGWDLFSINNPLHLTSSLSSLNLRHPIILINQSG